MALNKDAVVTKRTDYNYVLMDYLLQLGRSIAAGNVGNSINIVLALENLTLPYHNTQFKTGTKIEADRFTKELNEKGMEKINRFQDRNKANEYENLLFVHSLNRFGLLMVCLDQKGFLVPEAYVDEMQEEDLPDVVPNDG